MSRHAQARAQPSSALPHEVCAVCSHFELKYKCALYFFGNGKIFSVLGRVTEAANPRPAPHHQSRQGPPPLLCHLLEYCPPLHRLQLQIRLFFINRYWHIFYSVIFKFLLDTYFPRIIILGIFCRQYITSIAPFCRRARWCSRKGGRTY